MSSSLQSSFRYWLCAGTKSEGLKRQREQQQQQQQQQQHPHHLPPDVDHLILQLTHPLTRRLTPSPTITRPTTTTTPEANTTTTTTTPPTTTTTPTTSTTSSRRKEGMTAGGMPSSTPPPASSSSPSSPLLPPSSSSPTNYVTGHYHRRRREKVEEKEEERGGGRGRGGLGSQDSGLAGSEVMDRCQVRASTTTTTPTSTHPSSRPPHPTTNPSTTTTSSSSSSSAYSSSLIKTSASSPSSLSLLMSGSPSDPNTGVVSSTTLISSTRRVHRLYRTRQEDKKARTQQDGVSISSSSISSHGGRPSSSATALQGQHHPDLLLRKGKSLETVGAAFSKSISASDSNSLICNDLRSPGTTAVGAGGGRAGGGGGGGGGGGDSDLSKASSTLSSLCSDRDRDLDPGPHRDLHLHNSNNNNNNTNTTTTSSGNARSTRRIQKSATTTVLTYPQRASFDYESTTPELSENEEREKKEKGQEVEKEGEKKEKGQEKEKKRRFGKKMLAKTLRRSQSASSARDVPAHALFLRHQMGDKSVDTLEDRLGQRSAVSTEGSKTEGRGQVGDGEVRRTSLPRPIHKTTSADAAMMSRDEFGNITCPNKTNKKSLAKTMKRKLQFLRRRHTDTTLSTLAKAEDPQGPDVDPDIAQQWSRSFESLLMDKKGLELFRGFLRSEFSEENLEFWVAVEEFKLCKPRKLASVALHIYTRYVEEQAPREINVDSETRMRTLANLSTPGKSVFEEAQRKVQALMAKDSYPRFLESDLYKNIIRSSKC